MKHITLPVICSFCCLSIVPLFAQNASTSDCIGAIPICQPTYQENQSPMGTGNIADINGNINCNVEEVATTWYIFTVNETGKFGFEITPNAPLDDYDWALFDITNADCSDLFNDASLLVSCNAAGGSTCDGRTGATGDSRFDIQGAGCDDPTPDLSFGQTAFNDLIDVQAGNTYVLMVNNWTPNSVSGYTIDFGQSGDIGIFDVTPPTIDTVTFASSCAANELDVQFSESIQCNSINADNFSIDGPDAPYDITLESPNCDAGGNYSNHFLLRIDPPLPNEVPFALNLTVSETTEVIDLCSNPASTQTINIPGFVVNDTLSLGPDFAICDGDQVTLRAIGNSSNLVGATYQWEDGTTGSERTVNTVGTYVVTATYACGTLSDTITLFSSGSLSNLDLGPDQVLCPGNSLLLDAGEGFPNYLWQDGSTNSRFEATRPGTYSVTVSDDCVTLTDEIILSSSPPVFAFLEDRTICAGDVIDWDVTTTGATYRWEDGSTEAFRQVTEAGNYSVTISNACESQSLSATIAVEGTPIPLFNIGGDTTICPETTISVPPLDRGLTISWNDGSGNESIVIMTPGTYGYTITNECGNTKEESITALFDNLSSVDLGPDTVICPGSQIILEVTNENALSYLWQDNSTQPTLTVTQPGQYTVAVETRCETITSDITITECKTCHVNIPNIFSPNGDGFNDELRTFFDCPVQSFSLMVFDRWGNLLFTTNDPNTGWNGKNPNQENLTTGTYVWMVEATLEADKRLQMVKESGSIMLVR